jgi:hypothetical protein
VAVRTTKYVTYRKVIGLDATAAQGKKITNRKPTDLERIALLYLDISNINSQIAGLYGLRKQKEDEQKKIWNIIIEKAQRGEMPFDGFDETGLSGFE